MGNLLFIEKKFTNILLLFTDLIIFLRKVARIPEILFYFLWDALRSYLNVLFNVVVRRSEVAFVNDTSQDSRLARWEDRERENATERERERNVSFAPVVHISCPSTYPFALTFFFFFPWSPFSSIAVFSSIFYSNFHGGRKCGVSMEFDEAHSKHRRYTVIVFH